MSNELNLQGKGRIIIRLGRHHLSFSTIDASQTEAPVTYEPYVMKSGISVAANLREALKGAALDRMGIRKALVMVDVPILLIPIEIFEESKMDDMYNHSFPRKEQESVLYNVLPDLNAVAVFAINKDVKTVLEDNFGDVKIVVALTPVWRHLHRRSFTGARGKLYGYLHDQSSTSSRSIRTASSSTTSLRRPVPTMSSTSCSTSGSSRCSMPSTTSCTWWAKA